MILNRLGLNNLIEPITKDLEFQQQDPFLLYRNAKSKCRPLTFDPYLAGKVISLCHQYIAMACMQIRTALPGSTVQDNQLHVQVLILMSLK